MLLNVWLCVCQQMQCCQSAQCRVRLYHSRPMFVMDYYCNAINCYVDSCCDTLGVAYAINCKCRRKMRHGSSCPVREYSRKMGSAALRGLGKQAIQSSPCLLRATSRAPPTAYPPNTVLSGTGRETVSASSNRAPHQ